MSTSTPEDKDALNRFKDAVLGGDLPHILELLQTGRVTSLPKAIGARALILAASKGFEQTVEELLKAGATPDATTSDKKSAAYLAAEQNNPKMLSDLLAAGANPNGSPGKEPISVAIMRSNPKMLEILLAAGASTDVTNKHGANLLHQAAENSSLGICKRLMEAGVPADSRDPHGNTAMHYAEGVGSVALFRTLIEHGADVNARSHTGMTPLLVAARRCHVRIFESLVALGADPLVRNIQERNAFDLALYSDFLKKDEMGLMLLQHYPSLAPTGEALDAALVHAVRWGCAGLAKKLVELGADVGQKPGGRTLMQCAPRGNEEMKRLLRALKTSVTIDTAMTSGSEPPAHTSTCGSPIL